MGASESEPFNEELAGYKVIHRVPENNITHLSHIETDKEYLLREHTFNEDNMYKKVYNEHKQRQAISDDHLTHLGSNGLVECRSVGQIDRSSVF